MKNVRFVGLDVHAETIAVAVADGARRGAVPRSHSNLAESIRKLVKKLGPAEQLRVCYETGPTGYVLYWQLTGLGVPCEVMAPTLVPAPYLDRSFHIGVVKRCKEPSASVVLGESSR